MVTAENNATLQISRQKVIPPDLAKAADIITQTDKLIIFASGFSALLDEIAKHKIIKLGLNYKTCSDYQLPCSSIATMTNKGIIIPVKLSGK